MRDAIVFAVSLPGNGSTQIIHRAEISVQTVRALHCLSALILDSVFLLTLQVQHTRAEKRFELCEVEFEPDFVRMRDGETNAVPAHTHTGRYQHQDLFHLQVNFVGGGREVG